MLTKQIILAAVLAAAQGATATQRTYTTDQIAHRLGDGKLVGDACHPRDTWTLGGSVTIPPCISEQIVSLTCEDLTGALGAKDNLDKMNAYRSCLFDNGSSYEQDIYACFTCKAKHHIHSPGEDTFWRREWARGITAFKNANPLKDGLWDLVARPINWAAYPQDSKGVKDRDYSINEYYPNAPKQNIGKFTLDGITYPTLTSRALRARAEPARDGEIRDVKVTFHMKENSIVSIGVEREDSAA